MNSVKDTIGKPTVLVAMQENLGLRYEIFKVTTSINATGGKPHYYSLNTRAADFDYAPYLTSLERILLETRELLLRARQSVGV